MLTSRLYVGGSSLEECAETSPSTLSLRCSSKENKAQSWKKYHTKLGTLPPSAGDASQRGGGDSVGPGLAAAVMWRAAAKEMMEELKAVGYSYSDSEGESIIRYSYDNQNHREVCIIEYPESPGPSIKAVVVGNNAEEEEEDDGDKAEDLSRHPQTAPPPPQNTPAGGEGDGSGEAGATATTGDIKGLIRCERCGYNTNRYDHYIAHLKHHSKEGEDHRVFKCTLCPYTTVSQYHWRKHLRNHFPSKLHTCSQCSYFSDRKSNYIQHIRTHTGVRPFQCLYCDYSSSQKTHLTRHMRTHSGGVPSSVRAVTTWQPISLSSSVRSAIAASRNTDLQYHMIQALWMQCLRGLSKVKLRVKGLVY
ncbi:RE1-silencing transcription factor isoform X1 [Lates japonicus]|uniref:RE1-silencing transcription factor isoform X1 n=1 Tax=Lates japonicus TaxID=270547 RepID=A0AAD3RGE9_LATJO|nr:RE1-silencing transcription factor isoform X1 [Lates japonicus]